MPHPWLLGCGMVAGVIRLCCFLCYRKQYLECGAFARLGIDFNGAMMAAYDAKDGAHAQSTTGKFCGKERVEQFFPGCFIHAAAIIGNFQKYIATGWQRIINMRGFQVGCIGIHDAGMDDDITIVLINGFGCIDDQIHNHLLHLRLISFNRWQGIIQIGAQADILAD